MLYASGPVCLLKVTLSLLGGGYSRRGQEEDIHLGHAFARGCNAAAHKGAKNAPQVPNVVNLRYTNNFAGFEW